MAQSDLCDTQRGSSSEKKSLFHNLDLDSITPELVEFESRRTALSEKNFLAPGVLEFVREFRDKFPIGGTMKACDYGAGRRFNGRRLEEIGYDVTFYDVNQFRRYYGVDNEILYETTSVIPEGSKFDIIICNYTLNVLLHETRVKIVRHIFELSTENTSILVEVRGIGQVDREIGNSSNWTSFEDGLISKWGTFQKGFTPKELVTLLTKNGFKIVYSFHAAKEKVSLVAAKKESPIKPHKTALKLLGGLRKQSLEKFLQWR